MYRPKHFAEDRVEVLHQFIERHPLATVITAGSKGLFANLIPMSLHLTGEKGVLRGHLARANGQVERLRDGDEVLLLFQGPQSYVTPNFYATKKQDGRVVPTWNYSMVQVRGAATLMEDPQWVYRHLTDLTNQQEAGQEVPWKVTDAPEAYVSARMKAIVGIEIRIDEIEGKFKVSQNQPEENRKTVAEGFSEAGDEAMADLVTRGGLSLSQRKADRN